VKGPSKTKSVVARPTFGHPVPFRLPIRVRSKSTVVTTPASDAASSCVPASVASPPSESGAPTAPDELHAAANGKTEVASARRTFM
jgi:hypothetical protein